MERSAESINEVLKKARDAIRKNPKDESMHNLIAPVYESYGRYQEALPHLAFLVSVERTPSEGLLHRYAYALQQTGAFTNAQQVLEKALLQYPHSKSLKNSLALTFILLCQHEKARQTYMGLYNDNNDDTHALAMAGAMSLLISNMQTGFKEYASRPLDPQEAKIFEPFVQWAGQPVTGKSIVCWTEQGIGDAIMFISLVPHLVAQGAHVTLAVNPRLTPLLERSFAGVRVVSSSDEITNGQFDYQISLGGLMEHILPVYQPSNHPPYLKADSDKSQMLRARYLDIAKQHGRSRLIGLAWHTTNPQVGFTRNISLMDLKPVLSLPDIQFVSLQYGQHDKDIAEINKQFPNIIWSDEQVDAFNDLDGLAAQMMAMDEIITIANATAHLSGSLGVATTLLVPASPDWRWKLHDPSNVWYQSVHLERQEMLLNWKSVVKRVRNNLMAKQGVS
jgi:tetratricopeptide (TPR) repeat protein